MVAQSSTYQCFIFKVMIDCSILFPTFFLLIILSIFINFFIMVNLYIKGGKYTCSNSTILSFIIFFICSSKLQFAFGFLHYFHPSWLDTIFPCNCWYYLWVCGNLSCFVLVLLCQKHIHKANIRCAKFNMLMHGAQ
jgi:hypothetical protein